MHEFHPSRMKLTKKGEILTLKDESDDLGSRKRTTWMKFTFMDEIKDDPRSLNILTFHP